MMIWTLLRHSLKQVFAPSKVSSILKSVAQLLGLEGDEPSSSRDSSLFYSVLGGSQATIVPAICMPDELKDVVSGIRTNLLPSLVIE